MGDSRGHWTLGSYLIINQPSPDISSLLSSPAYLSTMRGHGISASNWKRGNSLRPDWQSGGCDVLTGLLIRESNICRNIKLKFCSKRGERECLRRDVRVRACAVILSFRYLEVWWLLHILANILHLLQIKHLYSQISLYILFYIFHYLYYFFHWNWLVPVQLQSSPGQIQSRGLLHTISPPRILYLSSQRG